MQGMLQDQLLEFARTAARRQLEYVRRSPFAAGLDDEGVRRRADLQRWLRSGQEVSFRRDRSTPWKRGVFLDMAAPKMALRVLVRDGVEEKIVHVDPVELQVATRLERRQLQLEARMGALEKELARFSQKGKELRESAAALAAEFEGVQRELRAEKTRVTALLPPKEAL